MHRVSIFYDGNPNAIEELKDTIVSKMLGQLYAQMDDVAIADPEAVMMRQRTQMMDN